MASQRFWGRAVIGAIATFLLLGGLYLISPKSFGAKEDKLLGAVCLASGISVLSWRYAAPQPQNDSQR